MQQLARKRYEWSRGTLGRQRIVGFPNFCWLTFGDTLKSINALTPLEWKACLNAETRRRRSFDRVAKRVKGFRDYHIAHPKPRDLTTPEIVRLCNVTRGLAFELRPNEWKTVCLMLRHERNFLIPIDSIGRHNSSTHFIHSLDTLRRIHNALSSWQVT